MQLVCNVVYGIAGSQIVERRLQAELRQVFDGGKIVSFFEQTDNVLFRKMKAGRDAVECDGFSVILLDVTFDPVCRVADVSFRSGYCLKHQSNDQIDHFYDDVRIVAGDIVF